LTPSRPSGAPTAVGSGNGPAPLPQQDLHTTDDEFLEMRAPPPDIAEVITHDEAVGGEVEEAAIIALARDRHVTEDHAREGIPLEVTTAEGRTRLVQNIGRKQTPDLPRVETRVRGQPAERRRQEKQRDQQGNPGASCPGHILRTRGRERSARRGRDPAPSR
jgi:hypothetical protein